MKNFGRVVWLTLVYVMLVVASVCIALPLFAQALVDFGHPTDVHWKIADTKDDESKKQEEKTLVITYDNDVGKTLTKLYEILYFPVEPSLLQLWFSTYILGIIYCFSVYRSFHLEDERFGEMLVLWLPGLAVQLMLFIGWFGAMWANSSYFDVSTTLQSVISDPEMVKKAASNHIAMKIAIGAVLVGSFLLADILVIVSWGAIRWIIDYIEERRIEKQESVLHSLGIASSNAILLNSQNVAALMSGEIKMRGWLIRWPSLRISLARQQNLDHFYQIFTSRAKDFAFQNMRTRLLTGIENRYGQMGKPASKRFGKVLCDQLEQAMVKFVEELQRPEGPNALKASHAVLQRVSDQKLRRFQQEMVEGIKSAIHGTLGDFQSNVLDNIKTRVLNIDSAFSIQHNLPAFPDGTKFFLRRGKASVVVVQEKPQVRSISFSSRFLSGEPGLGKINAVTSRRFRLAFPYVVFVAIFVDDKQGYDGFKAYYAKRPLETLDDPLFQVNLPNIDAAGHTCLGGVELSGQTLSQKIQELITHFWQSEFTNDWDAQHHEMRAKDPRLASIRQWEEHSLQNALFPLHVDWNSANLTVRQCIKRVDGGATNLGAMFDRARESAIEQELGLVGEVARKFCSEIKIDRAHSKVVQGELEKHLLDLISSLTDQVLRELQNLTATEAKKAYHRFEEVICQCVQKVFAEDFNRFGEEISLQRMQDVRDLIWAMRERG